MIFGSFLIECGNELPQSGALHVLIDLALSLQLVNPSNVFYGNQSSLPHSILGSRNSHTHAGTASNCSSFTKQGTGLHEKTSQNPQWY